MGHIKSFSEASVLMLAGVLDPLQIFYNSVS